MPEVVPCPNCDKKIKVPDGAEGKKLRCASCESILLVTEDGLEVAKKAPVQGSVEKPASRPARKPAPADEDEDEAPKRKRADREEDDDDEPKPKRAKRDEDEEDEDEGPAKKKKKRKKSGGGMPRWVWIASGAAACVLIGVVLWLMLSGGKGDFSKVKEGMTEEEITALVGTPFARGFEVTVWTNPPISMADHDFDQLRTMKVKEQMQVKFVNGRAKEIRIQSGNSSGYAPSASGDNWQVR